MQKFLTPVQFNAQFGPTAATMTAASQAITAAGFDIVVSVRDAPFDRGERHGRPGQFALLTCHPAQHGQFKSGATKAVSITPPMILASSPLERER